MVECVWYENVYISKDGEVFGRILNRPAPGRFPICWQASVQQKARQKHLPYQGYAPDIESAKKLVEQCLLLTGTAEPEVIEIIPQEQTP